MSIKSSIKFASTYRHLPYSKFDFRYERNGPWPQLMPDRPLGDLPEVVKIPPFEQKQYSKYVTRVYYKRLFLTSFYGLIYAMTHDRYQKFDDARFTRQLTEGVYSKFLFPWPDRDPGSDRGIGPELAAKVRESAGDNDIVYVDFAMIECISDDCLPGNYVAPTTVVFKKTGTYRFDVIALKIRDLVLCPADGHAWELAKYFALQAAEYSIKFIYHISLHFPFDTVNALTKSTLPTEHIIYKLLDPHLLLSLPVNNAVLESPRSVVCDDPKKSPFYSPFATKSAYVRKMLHLATDGIYAHKAYPTYDFFKVRPLNSSATEQTREAWRTREVPSRFGEVMNRYWPPYHDFVAGVVRHYQKRIEKLNDAYNDPNSGQEQLRDEAKELDLDKLSVWANQIANYIPGFPRDSDIISGDPGHHRLHEDVLTEALTTILWTVSLAHAMDHVDDARIEPDEKPYRIRLPAPESTQIEPFSRKDLVNRWDFFPSTLIREAFTTPITTRSMLQVKYDFRKNSGLNALAREFLANLKKVEQDIGNDRSLDRDDSGGQWIRLKDVACSVQY